MTVLRRGLPVIIAVVLFAALGVAEAAPSWDGTWAGAWEKDAGVQIIASDKVIGVFCGGDYPDIQRSQLSAGGRSLTIAWTGGDGTLVRGASRMTRR